MKTETYNGWTNKETWNINLEFENIFQSMADEQNFRDTEHMAEAFENIVFELTSDNLEATGFVRGIVSEYLNAVNFEEIAGHFFKEEEEVEEVEEV